MVLVPGGDRQEVMQLIVSGRASRLQWLKAFASP